MKNRSAIRKFVAVLCALALFVVQSFGGQAGYLCLCGDQVKQTVASHCHGPHGDSCHEEEAASHNEEGQGERKDHEAVSTDVQSALVQSTIQIVPPQFFLAVLPLFEVLIAASVESNEFFPSARYAESPPIGVSVARTVVLLI